MPKTTCIIFLGFVTLAACHRQEEAPLPFQLVHLNYSTEDGLWAYAPEAYFFILDDSTTFDDSTGVPALAFVSIALGLVLAPLLWVVEQRVATTAAAARPG